MEGDGWWKGIKTCIRSELEWKIKEENVGEDSSDMNLNCFLFFFFKLKASQVLPIQQSYIHEERPEQKTLRNPKTYNCTQALKLICVSCYIIQDAICYKVVLLSFYVGVTFQNKPESNAKSFKTQQNSLTSTFFYVLMHFLLKQGWNI